MMRPNQVVPDRGHRVINVFWQTRSSISPEDYEYISLLSGSCACTAFSIQRRTERNFEGAKAESKPQEHAMLGAEIGFLKFLT